MVEKFIRKDDTYCLSVHVYNKTRRSDNQAEKAIEENIEPLNRSLCYRMHSERYKLLKDSVNK